MTQKSQDLDDLCTFSATFCCRDLCTFDAFFGWKADGGMSNIVDYCLLQRPPMWPQWKMHALTIFWMLHKTLVVFVIHVTKEYEREYYERICIYYCFLWMAVDWSKILKQDFFVLPPGVRQRNCFTKQQQTWFSFLSSSLPSL